MYGQDTYRIKKKIDEIVSEYGNKYFSGLNLSRLNMIENDMSDIHKAIDVVSMFSEKKLIVVSNIFETDSVKKDMLEYLTYSDVTKNSEVIFVVDGGNVSAVKLKNDKLLEFFLKNSKSQEFKFLDTANLRKWIIGFLRKDGVQITEKALAGLINFVGNDLWQMEQELLKLSSLVLFESRNIVEDDDVDNLVKSKIVMDIFNTVDSLAKKNRLETLKSLKKHIQNGDDALYILSMFIYQFRNIIQIKSLLEEGDDINIASGKVKMHPYVLLKSAQQAGLFSFDELKKIYRIMFQVDLSIKTGRIKPDTALDLLVVEITR